MKKSVNDWRPHVQLVLESKVEEFILMGYSKATVADIWKCLQESVWKENYTKRLYEIVRDIYHLRATTYMNYLTINAYGDDDFMSSIAALTEG